MATFERDALFTKSIVFIKRALAHRDDSRPDEFQLWAALALELLGKSALAAIHPALIAIHKTRTLCSPRAAVLSARPKRRSQGRQFFTR